MKQMHVLLIDDHAMFRSGMALVIGCEFPQAMVWQAASVSRALELAIPAPSAVLLDIRLGDESGLEGIGLIHRRWPDVPVLMLSAFDEASTIQHAISRDAVGLISKVETADVIVKAVQSMADGTYKIEHPGDPRPGHDEPQRRLTPRQREVLQLLHQGLSNILIARKLNLSNNTVRRHVQDILEALKVPGRSEAVMLARAQFLVM